jgi:hypothetical protein
VFARLAGYHQALFSQGDSTARVWSLVSRGRGPNMIDGKTNGGHVCDCPRRTGTGPTTTGSSITFSVRSSSQSKSLICMENAFLN